MLPEEWMRKFETLGLQKARLLACDYAEHVAHYVPDEPLLRIAIAMARRYANGEATALELAAAYHSIPADQGYPAANAAAYACWCNPGMDYLATYCAAEVALSAAGGAAYDAPDLKTGAGQAAQAFLNRHDDTALADSEGGYAAGVRKEREWQRERLEWYLRQL